MLGVVAAGTTPASAGSAVVSMVADQLATALLLLIFGVSTVAQEFAVRYLARCSGTRFSFGAGLFTGSTALMVTASTTVALAAGWTAAGINVLPARLYWELPIARDGLRRTVIAFNHDWRWGTLAAVAVLAIRTGTIDLSRLSAIGGSTGTLAAVLVVVAALSRSAQIPFHRWLPATLAAPTPVSALLHAGVVNAGGICSSA
jgi:NADH:ubiquinone oxidoreductase subunit 5 (subunit L)/multisubunit Na+/H+ antiporter MnhA subunit